MKHLVIVESPAKAKTINKILGKDYTVAASVGHVMDLPKKTLGVDVDKGFEPEYTVIPGKEKVIRELKQAAKKADRVYLAPDPDREGEAIAYHIASEIKGTGSGDDRIFRVTFNEITARAVREAVESPRKIDMDKVEAQQARRVLDRLVGYNLSPLLWKKIRRGLSAGRVQSVAVRIMVEREREIQAFNKEEYWSITARLLGPKPPAFDAKLFKLGGELLISRDDKSGNRFLITDEARAEEMALALRAGKYSLSRIERKQRKRSPAPPFITSTLQQEAARKLGFPAKKTMSLAQQLYEGVEIGSEGSQGLITYMRTDSVRLAEEARTWARAYIIEKFGEEYAPAKPNVYKSKASAQEAHEAVRPTSAAYAPEAVASYLSRDQQRLYALIWNRFMASQMKPAALEQTTMDIETLAGKTQAVFRATGSVIKFPGFMALYTESIEDTEEEDGGILPALKEGDALSLEGLSPKQHFTQPPPRFTEASLVKALEEKGIGRPSTYAAIISTITDREYVARDQGRFAPTELGFIVNDYLVEGFPELMDVGFTARMEDELDSIEEGKLKWAKAIGDFYGPFKKSLAKAEAVEGKAKPKDVTTDETCEKCGKPMVKRWGRHGWFLACSGFPECKNARPLEGDDPSAAVQAAKKDEPTNELCPKCASPMVIKSGRFGKFLACSKYPECKTTKPIPTGVKCPEDGGDLIERRSRTGKQFWSCGNYPECKFSLWQRPVPEPCPLCKAPFLIIKKDRAGKVVKSCRAEGCTFSEELAPPPDPTPR